MSGELLEDEGRLESACRAGQPDAVDHVVSLLTSAHPYTRGRAAEMLARAPAPVVAAWAAERLNGEGLRAIEWYALAEHARVQEALPDIPGLEVCLATTVEGQPTGDEASQLLDLVDWLPPDQRRPLLRRLAAHPDPEVMVESAWRLDESGEAPEPDVLERLAEVPLGGAAADMAAVLRASHGDRGALPLLVEQVVRQGFLAWRALGVLEARGDEAAAVALRPVYARWWPGVLAPRAAATAARLGAADASSALERMAGSWRPAIRYGARAERLRLGPASALQAWQRRAGVLSAEEVIPACEALARRGDEAGRDILQSLMLDDPRGEVRLPALEALLDADPGGISAFRSRGLGEALKARGLWSQEIGAIVAHAELRAGLR